MRTISFRLTAILSALVAFMLVVGTVGFMSGRSTVAGLSHVYDNAVIPLRDLKIISDRYAVDIVDLTHKTSAGAMTMSDGSKSIAKALAEIDAIWKRYVSDNRSEKERELIAKADVLLATARAAAEKSKAFMDAMDLAALQDFRTKELYPAIDPGTEMIGSMVDAKLEEARAALEAEKSSTSIANLTIAIVAIAALFLGFGAIFFVRKSVIAPLGRTVLTLRQLDEATVGMLPQGMDRISAIEQVEVTGHERRDEIGEISRALQTFKHSGVEAQRLRDESETEQQIRASRAARIEEIVKEFENAAMSVISSVATSSAELEASAKSMLEVAQTASEQSTMVAAASHQTSESVQALAATGDELSLSIGEIGRQAEQSSSFAARASDRANATNVTVQRLSDVGASIVEVIDLIKSIAGQTNLLALNATIEAARAGEAGRGFAVVAAEVKELATQTTRATDVISERVAAIRQASDESTDAMREITGMISEINQVAAAIAVAVTEQSQATQGIAENVQQVAQGSAHASESIAIVNEAAANTGAAASQVLSASEELARQSQMMRDKVDWFLHEVRAA